MLSIGYIPPALMNKSGTIDSFAQHFDEWIGTIEKGTEIVNNQIKPVSEGTNGFIHSGNYNEITTDKPLTNFQPFFPDQNYIGSQVKSVRYDLQLIPLPIAYPDITTGTPVGKFNFVNNPPPVGTNLNTSI